MALAIKIGDTYNTGLLVNAPVVDIDITDYIGTYVLISNEHETDVEVAESDEKTFKLHKIVIDREKAEEFFTDFDSIPTFSTYPDWQPNLAVCKEWDGWEDEPMTPPTYYIPPFATKIYAGTNGRDQNAETEWFAPSNTPLYPPTSYSDETEYEEDWSNFEAEDWKWKYCKFNFQQIIKPVESFPMRATQGCWYAFPASFDYDAPSDPQGAPYDYENPYGTNIYRLNSEWQMYRMIYPSEISKFGISHRWNAVDAGGGKYEINNVARLFCNPVGSAVNSMENFLPRVKDKDDNWVSLGANIYTEVYSPLDSPEVPKTDRYPEEGVPYLNKFFFVHYTYDGEEYYAIMVCNVYDIEDKGIYQIEGWGISENFYTLGVEPTPDPEEGQEEPGDGGVRPPRIDQTPQDGRMGLNFDLGLSSRNPATRGLKLTYMPMGSLNAYIDAYITDRMNILPDLPGPGDEIINTLLAPATEAIMRMCYDTFLDVYKLPVAPAGATGFTVFNVGGIEVSSEGAGGQYNFSQKREVDMGVLNLREIFGSYLDYAPNMKAFIWLPFCGMFEIPINSFMKGGLELKYIIDLLSGSCTAYLFGIDRTNHSTLIGSFGGDMKLPVPLAAVAANTGIIGQALRNGLNSFASTQSQPFLTTRVAQQNIARGQQAYDFINSGQSGVGGIGTMLGTGFGAIGEVETNIQNFGKGIAGGVAKGADFIASMREAEPVLSAVIGQVGGIGGWCGWTQPYVRIVAPVRSNPQDYTHFLGRPANVRKQIRDLQTGTLNRANAPRITIPNATQQEKDAIYRILTTGFYK